MCLSGHCVAQAEGRIGWSARLRVTDETARSKSSTRNRKLDGTNKNETNTNLIQHDQRHRSVSVDGRLRHHQQQFGFAIRTGFKLLPADTPKKQELLKTLTPGKLTLITWKGKQFYVQPDAPNNQAYVGTPAEYQTYQQLRLAQKLSHDNLMAAQMNQDAIVSGGPWGPDFTGG